MPVDPRVKAGKLWPVLTELAAGKAKLTHVELGRRVGILHRNLTGPLDVIAKQCARSNWPPLTAIIVTTEAADGAAAAESVYAFDWTKVKNPFELFASTK